MLGLIIGAVALILVLRWWLGKIFTAGGALKVPLAIAQKMRRLVIRLAVGLQPDAGRRYAVIGLQDGNRQWCQQATGCQSSQKYLG